MFKGLFSLLRPAARSPLFGKHGKDSFVGTTRELSGADHIYIGDRCHIRENAWLGAFSEFSKISNQTASITIEDDVYIGFNATITAIGQIIIQKGALISDGFYASDHTHGHHPTAGPPRYQPLVYKGPVRVGENSFIGFRVTLMPNVTLGRHCVVGAHSVVTKSFPDYSMVAGAPARLLKTFDFQTAQWSPVPA